ncbi:MAG: phosphatase PAP2 family protein [Chloroflexota bacterium]
MINRLSILDTYVSRQCALPAASSGWRLARLVAHLGDGPYVFGSLAGFYLLGWLLDEVYLRRATLFIILEIGLVMLMITVIKYLIRRERPRPPGEFVSFGYDAYSFPSGHAARMAALAVGVTVFFPGLGWPAVVIGLGVALARVAVGVHYVSDILVGLAIGASLAWGDLWFLERLFILSWTL